MIYEMRAELVLKKFKLRAKLGCLPEELRSTQEVLVQIKFRFNSLPFACLNDTITDTICYASLADRLQRYCQDNSFKLIENLTYKLHQYIREEIGTNKSFKLFVEVIKNPPDLPQLSEARFSVSD